MKKFLKVVLMICLIFTVFLCGGLVYYSAVTAKYTLSTDKLINTSDYFELYDTNDEKLNMVSQNNLIIKNSDLQKHTKQAFIAIEDKRFYKHKGIDYKGILRATVKNVTSGKLSQGGSTISQQLIKNTHLTPEKTLKRKLIEVKLTKKLEKNYSKDEILEKYLNTIYFGYNVYGISNASKFYFNKPASELTLSESALLAGMVKAPNVYSPISNIEKAKSRRDLVLDVMQKNGDISIEIAKSAKSQPILCDKNAKEYDYTSLCLTELSKIISDNPYIFSNCKVYTYCLPEYNDYLKDEILFSTENCQKSAVLTGAFNEVLAYYSTTSEVKRQIGSLMKPIGVYAPSIEENLIYSLSPILDEETTFNDYKPSNYKDKYYGYVTAKDALSKSLNVPAVKILNSLGVEKSISYLKKMNLSLDANNNGLSLALGGTDTGFTLTDVTASYGTFNSNGLYYSPTCIKKIVSNNGTVLYEHKPYAKKVFSKETSYIISDMLEETVKTGTAKRLINKNATIYAKTGTNGSENGNTDAYTVSYTKDYVLGTWCGNTDNSLMDNSISGGTTPAKISSSIWDLIYKTPSDTKIEKPNSVILADFDKNEYELNKKLVLSEEIAPHTQKFTMLIKEDQLNSFEKLTKYSNPTVDLPNIELENGTILIKFNQDKYINFIINRYNSDNKELIFDSKTDKNCKGIYDEKTKGNTSYTYTVLPYYEFNDKIFYGEEIKISTIKTPTVKVELPDDWWDYELDFDL